MHMHKLIFLKESNSNNTRKKKENENMPKKKLLQKLSIMKDIHALSHQDTFVEIFYIKFAPHLLMN